MTRPRALNGSWTLWILVASTACAHRTDSTDELRNRSGHDAIDAGSVEPVESDEMIVRLYDVRDIVTSIPNFPGGPHHFFVPAHESSRDE